MEKKKAAIDIVNEVLEDCILAYPVSPFIISLYKQYQQRGSLSKKQLQGLYSKAEKIENISTAKLGTLEAIIKKMPTRYKSEAPATVQAVFQRDESTGELLNSILEKFPQHKRALFLKSKYENDETLSAVEISELKKFQQLVKH